MHTGLQAFPIPVAELDYSSERWLVARHQNSKLQILLEAFDDPLGKMTSNAFGLRQDLYHRPRVVMAVSLSPSIICLPDGRGAQLISKIACSVCLMSFWKPVIEQWRQQMHLIWVVRPACLTHATLIRYASLLVVHQIRYYSHRLLASLRHLRRLCHVPSPS